MIGASEMTAKRSKLFDHVVLAARLRSCCAEMLRLGTTTGFWGNQVSQILDDFKALNYNPSRLRAIYWNVYVDGHLMAYSRIRSDVLANAKTWRESCPTKKVEVKRVYVYAKKRAKP